MNDVYINLITALASNPALLLLCVVLVGGGWLTRNHSEVVINYET